MSEPETAWLAGLLEGEGCFRLRMDYRGPGSRYPIYVVLKMNDEDIVKRAHQLMGAKTIGVVQRPRRSDAYVITVHSHRAEAVMRSVLPYMGLRRRAKVVECLTTDTLSHHGPSTIVPSEDSFGACAPLGATRGPFSVFWLAGLLEGEGCFSLQTDNRVPGNRTGIRVGLKMNDEDVVCRAGELMGAPVYLRSDLRPNYSDSYEVRINGYPAEELMRTVLPHMGNRRSAKIRECLGTPNLRHHPRVSKVGEAIS